MKILYILLIILIGCGNPLNTTGTDSGFDPGISGTQDATTISSTGGAFQYNDGTVAASCYEYLNSPLYSGQGDNVYWIDSDGTGGNSEYKVYCDMTTNGGGWTLLSNQGPIIGNLHPSLASASQSNESDPTSNLYSIIYKMGEFERSGVFELFLTWPDGGACTGVPHHWTQSSNPYTTSESVTGYASISTPGASGWNGLCLSSQTASALLDGNCGSGNWWYAVGSRVVYSGTGAPSCGSTVTHVQLWVR